MPGVPCGNKALTATPTSAVATGTNPNAFNPSINLDAPVFPPPTAGSPAPHGGSLRGERQQAAAEAAAHFRRLAVARHENSVATVEGDELPVPVKHFPAHDGSRRPPGVDEEEGAVGGGHVGRLVHGPVLPRTS